MWLTYFVSPPNNVTSLLLQRKLLHAHIPLAHRSWLESEERVVVLSYSTWIMIHEASSYWLGAVHLEQSLAVIPFHTYINILFPYMHTVPPMPREPDGSPSIYLLYPGFDPMGTVWTMPFPL